MLKALTAALVIFMVGTLGSAHASLIVHGGGLVYDTDLNITWYANPNYVTHVYGDYAAWAAGLNVGGVTGWRVPTTPGTTTGITNEGEMGHLFYDELKNPVVLDGVGQPTGRFDNKGPFTNLNAGFYTSTTPVTATIITSISTTANKNWCTLDTRTFGFTDWRFTTGRSAAPQSPPR